MGDMGRGGYQVKVLHFLNPYLIWVEVNSSQSTSEFLLEQVGIYGILPLDITVDSLSNTLDVLGSNEWMPAVTALMKQEFTTAKEIQFIPAYVEESKTIFDDNIHKYGELILISSDGTQKQLSKLFVEKSLGFLDVPLFHQELSKGNLKTKISITQAKEVIEQIEKSVSQIDNTGLHVKSVKNQTVVLQTAQEIESALTIMNIEKHNMKHENDLILKKKLEDLELCKGVDVDEESVGRAVRSLKLAATPDKNCEPNTSKNLNSKCLKKMLRLSKDSQTNTASILAVGKATHAGENDCAAPKMKLDDKPVTMNISENVILKENKKITHSDVNSKLLKKITSKKTPEGKSKKAIAYGPPGLDKKDLILRPEPSTSDQEEDHYFTPTKPVDEEHEMPIKCNSFGNLDSEVNFEITDSKSLFNNITKMTIKSYTLDNKHKVLDANSPVSNNDNKIKSRILKRKFKLHKEKILDVSISSSSDTTNKDISSDADMEKSKVLNNNSDEEDIEELLKQISLEYNPGVKPVQKEHQEVPCNDMNNKNCVNPFKNVEANMSVFVDKLITPSLMVHTKMKTRITPRYELRDIPLNTHIKNVLKILSVEQPMMLQSVSWYTILRGYSVFLISPMDSGKTFGYLPAVCSLVNDSTSRSTSSVGPTAIIVCATAQSVTNIEKLSKMFLDLHKKVLACYAGMDEFSITTGLLNGCDLLICTPMTLVRLLYNTNFGVDLRRLSTFVLDDCERLSEVYMNEVKFFFFKIKEMLKNRAQKEFKVQYVIASRVWCDFMESLARKVPDSVLCFRAFQECVLYSRCPTIVKFVQQEKKVSEVLDFLKEVDVTKKIVIVCRTDDEVTLLEKELLKTNHLVLACNNTMTVHDLYNINITWKEYQDPSLGPILLCCDNNLTHLNIEDAHSLLHFSLPSLFSSFCKRFSVLNDNYSSIFKSEKQNVKIKILLDDSNVEQLPKILNFIKRCSYEVPKALEEVCQKLLAEKDVVKAQNLVPLCDCLLAFGECPDFWNCQQRHAVLKNYDEPKDWMPKGGFINFKILHYHTAAHYSVRIMSNLENGVTTRYQSYRDVSFKMSNYFSKESNKRPFGIPKVGDICAVSVRQNFYVRCQIIKILSNYNNGNPNYVRIKLLDEEKYEDSRDIYLYYLPDHLKNIETYVVQVRLANIQPKDKDITFSDLALNSLKTITDNDEELYMRAKVVKSLGNCIFVDTLEACQTLNSNEVVVKHDFKKELLNVHAIVNLDHLKKLKNICKDINFETDDALPTEEKIPNETKYRVIPRWAHLDSDDVSSVFFASAESPDKFYVRLAKFEDCMNTLIKDIKKYTEENPAPAENVCVGDIVLAKFPDDSVFERAKIDQLLTDKVKCFFVDQGDWRDVSVKDLIPITEKLIKQMPFQAIECRLIGIKPVGESWTAFCTNWFCDLCYEENHEFLKNLYVRYFTKEKAECTDGYKYGVVLIDTTSDNDVIINERLIDVNLAQENLDELHFLKNFDFQLHANKNESSVDENEWEKISNNSSDQKALTPSPSHYLFKQPLRSVPLVPSDDESDDFDKWDVNMGTDFVKSFHSTPQPGRDVSPTVNIVHDATMDNFKQNNDVTDQIAKNKLPLSSIAVSSIEKKVHDFSSKVPEGKTDNNLNHETNITDYKVEKKSNSSNSQDVKRKPKIIWKQTKRAITIKILLICDNYELQINQRSLEFSANANDTDYSFQLELYGVLDITKCSHSNKGQYILVKMIKLLQRSWLSLTKEVCLEKWIVYDIDSIEISSDEEEVVKDHLENIVKKIHDNTDSDSDDEFVDDSNFRYNK